MLRITLVTLMFAGLAVLAAPVQGQDVPAEGDATAEVQQVAQAAPETFPLAKGIAIVGVCLGAGICAVGGGYGIARIGSACIESIARQPEAGGAMFAPMVVAAAMVEGGMLFAIVVCLLGVLKT